MARQTDKLHNRRLKEQLPAAVEQTIRDALYAEWRVIVRRRTGLGVATWVAAAVGVLVAARTMLVTTRPGDRSGEIPIVASVQRANGQVEFYHEGTGSPESSHYDGLAAGDVAATGEGGASLELSQGGSLRLKANSKVAFVAEREIELLSGAVYFDSYTADGSPAAFTVHTSSGTIRDVGTQFLADLGADLLQVSVREGAIALDRGSLRTAAVGGERVSVGENGRIERASVAVYGDAWAWVERLAPTYDIDGKTVFDFLVWIERETGRRVVFASPEVEDRARFTRLRGKVDLEPLLMLRAVMAMTDFTYTTSGREIVVAHL